MMAKITKYFLIILISNIFSQSQILWDFGVEVSQFKQSYTDTLGTELKVKSKKNKKQNRCGNFRSIYKAK